MESRKRHEPYTNLKLSLAGKGKTYKDIAEIIGVSETTVMLKINGTSDFYLSEAEAIIDSCGLDMSVFFE